MKYRYLGENNLKASLIGYGAWKAGVQGWTGADGKKAVDAVSAAFDLGINYFDTAPIYGMGRSEEVIGKALKGCRDQTVIATKVGLVWDDRKRVKKFLGYKSILKEIDDSLKRLQTERIDLIQIHWDDHQTPAEEIAEAFEKAKSQEKVSYFGVCNLSMEKLKKLHQLIPLLSYQGYYNLIDRNSGQYLIETLEYQSGKEIIPYCRENGLTFIPYSPLSQGFLSDHFDVSEISKKDVRNSNHTIKEKNDERLKYLEIARRNNMSLSDLAVAWLSSDETIGPVIISSLNTEHIRQNIEALELTAKVRELKL